MIAVMAKSDEGLAARIKALREAAGMTQQQLANAAGLSMSLISQMEQGTKADPRLSTLQTLAQALGVTVDELISDKPAGKRRRKGD